MHLGTTSTSTLAAPPPRVRTALRLVVNPTASRLRLDVVDAVQRTLGASFEVSTAWTEARGHAGALAREAAAEGIEVVAVIGGDGTIGEAADALAWSATALACLPAGCTDAFARSIGVGRSTHGAAARLAAAIEAGPLHTRAVDMGIVDGRHFVGTAGVGFSAAMTAAADRIPEGKAALGQLHFVRAAAGELASTYLRCPPRMRVDAAGRSAEAVTVVVQNSAALTYLGTRRLRACAAAGLDSGSVSLTSLRRARPRDVAGVVARLLSGRDVTVHPQVDAFPALAYATVTAADGEALPVEADGEFLGHRHHIEFGVAPRALQVVA